MNKAILGIGALLGVAVIAKLASGKSSSGSGGTAGPIMRSNTADLEAPITGPDVEAAKAAGWKVLGSADLPTKSLGSQTFLVFQKSGTCAVFGYLPAAVGSKGDPMSLKPVIAQVPVDCAKAAGRPDQSGGGEAAPPSGGPGDIKGVGVMPGSGATPGQGYGSGFAPEGTVTTLASPEGAVVTTDSGVNTFNPGGVYTTPATPATAIFPTDTGGGGGAPATGAGGATLFGVPTSLIDAIPDSAGALKSITQQALGGAEGYLGKGVFVVTPPKTKQALAVNTGYFFVPGLSYSTAGPNDPKMVANRLLEIASQIQSEPAYAPIVKAFNSLAFILTH